MAATDARPEPLKNQAYRHYFALEDPPGTPLTSDTGLDSERSLDGTAFADCTNEATHVADGTFYLDFTATEMGANSTVAHIKNSSGTVLKKFFITPADSVAVKGAVDAGSFTPTAVMFESDDITEATAGHYIGRTIVWLSGALQYQATSITGYELSGSNGRFTVATMTEPPADNDTFLIVS